ncbi:MAG: hypothetical protein D6800_01780, partial [Candidatus Zixiibacteriota bacterium]
GIRPEQFEGEYGPSEPITEEQYDVLRQYLESNGGPLKESDFIQVDDKFVASRVQEVCDFLTNRNDMAINWLLSELYCNIFGHTCCSFEWETSGPNKDNFRFDILNPLSVYTDPTQIDIGKRHYHIEEIVMSLDQAVATWPDFKNELEAAANDGLFETNDPTVDVGASVNYERKMVTIVLAWLRYQKVPMTVEEALEEQLVRETGDGQYMLVETGEIVEPQQDVDHQTAWPDTNNGLRQIVCIPDRNIVIEDIRCPHWDIPRVWNMNIPRPDMSAYGQGEPVRLRHLDDMINMTMTILINYMAFSPFPAYFWPADTLAELSKHGINLFRRPNANIPIPRKNWLEIVRSGGFASTKHDTPPIPPGFINLLDRLLAEHDNLSGNVAVRQGREPFAGASGRLVESLQQASDSALSVKSRFLENSVVRFYRLLIHAIVNWMPEKKWKKILGRYTMPVIHEIIGRASMSDFNIMVKIKSGLGVDDKYEQDKALIMHQNGLKSSVSAMADLGVPNPEKEFDKVRNEQVVKAMDKMKVSMMARQQAQQQQAEQQQGQEQS